MKIRRICAYRVELPLVEGSYRWSGGKSVSVFDSTVVRIDTDAGVTGYGEVCPLGPFYLPAYANGVRAGIAELGPHLLGEDPRELLKLNRLMDAALKGHAYVKSAIDVACWDVLGKVTDQPVCTLLGGRYGDDFVLYRAISQESPDAMAARVAGYRAEGYRRFQLKVGGDPDVDVERIRAVAAQLRAGDRLVADANTGWLMHDAMRVVRAVRDVDVYVEQPCMSYEECLSIRRHTDHPFVLDEVIDSVEMVLRARADNAMDVVNLKISKPRRADQGEAGARPVRVVGRGDDAGGQLGRRRGDGGHRAPGTQHAAGVSVHGDGFQQLRHRQHRRGRAEARQRPHERLDGAGAGRHAADGGAGQAGGRGRVMPYREYGGSAGASSSNPNAQARPEPRPPSPIPLRLPVAPNGRAEYDVFQPPPPAPAGVPPPCSPFLAPPPASVTACRAARSFGSAPWRWAG